MEKKEMTAKRKARRKYEELNKEERKAATKQYNTRLPSKDYDDISAFLKKHQIRKIDLIYAGYCALKDQYEKLDK